MYSIKSAIAKIASTSCMLYGANGFLSNSPIKGYYGRLSQSNLPNPKERKLQLSKIESTEDLGMTKSSLIQLNGIENLIKETNCSTLLLDMWGVMHDGTQAYHGVLDTVKKLKEVGVKMIILSNSSKRKKNAESVLKKLGFNLEDFVNIITSGEISYQMLEGSNPANYASCPFIQEIVAKEKKEKKLFVLGSGDNDEEYCNSCGWELASIEDANLILARGTFTVNNGSKVIKKEENDEIYYQELQSVLSQAASRRLPMLVTNPDKVRPDKDLSPMPGSIGDMYEAILGGGEEATQLVKRIGKPYSEVYDIALQGLDPQFCCMVGDALETDVSGGINAGCSTLWVCMDGIHSTAITEESETSMEEGAKAILNKFNIEKGRDNQNILSPSFIIPHFRW